MTVYGGDVIFAADLNYIFDRTADKPVCILTQAAAQAIADNTETAITFGSGSETLDTSSMHSTSTNNTRVTPTMAGWYRCVGTFFVPAGANNDYITVGAAIRKNGTVDKWERVGPLAARAVAAGASVAVSASRSVTVVHEVEVNGSTDYIELAGYQNNAAAASRNTPGAGSFACKLSVEFIRDPD